MNSAPIVDPLQLGSSRTSASGSISSSTSSRLFPFPRFRPNSWTTSEARPNLRRPASLDSLSPDTFGVGDSGGDSGGGGGENSLSGETDSCRRLLFLPERKSKVPGYNDDDEKHEKDDDKNDNDDDDEDEIDDEKVLVEAHVLSVTTGVQPSTWSPSPSSPSYSTNSSSSSNSYVSPFCVEKLPKRLGLNSIENSVEANSINLTSTTSSVPSSTSSYSSSSSSLMWFAVFFVVMNDR